MILIDVDQCNLLSYLIGMTLSAWVPLCNKKKEMPIKKTIAIVGATESKATEIVYQFAKSNFRLLLISKDLTSLSLLSDNIAATNPNAEIDFLECVKDGCWEADVIILAIPWDEEKYVAELMKEVATQKIVVSISDERNAHDELQQILPYSKLVKVSLSSHSKEIMVSGFNEEAKKEISEIFENAGYVAKKINHFIGEISENI